MIIRTIKGIENDKWIKLKMLAARRNIALGKLIENMIEDYSNKTDEIWDRILSGKRIISDREADERIRETAKLRKEKGFRI